MKKETYRKPPCSILLFIIFLVVIVGSNSCEAIEKKEVIDLPDPKYSGKTAIEEALLKRKSVRNYTNETLSLSDVSQLLWSAQGITRSGVFRTAPSAGALYPLEVYIVAGDVNNLSAGIYKYSPQKHELIQIEESDKRAELAKAAGLRVMTHFRSDGREGDLNLYTILTHDIRHQMNEEFHSLPVDRSDANATI